MPTSNAEANKIIEILNRRIKPAVTFQTANELNNEVGLTTDNESLKITLAMLLYIARTNLMDSPEYTPAEKSLIQQCAANPPKKE